MEKKFQAIPDSVENQSRWIPFLSEILITADTDKGY